YNLNPDVIRALIPDVWSTAGPVAILAAQAAAFGPALAAATAALDPGDLAELADLSGTAGRAATAHVEGRVLLAGLASLPWPSDDHLVIWHAAKILREHRGDGHVALL